MCHPFHRIIAQSQSGHSAEHDVSGHPLLPVTQSRRGWLGSLVAAGAAAVAFWKGSSAEAAQVGGSAPAPGKVTTQALGEEGGGGYPPADPGPVTTQALGEEGAGYPLPSYPTPSYPSPSYPAPTYPSPSYPSPSYPSPGYPSPPSGPITTQALGEEGACCPPSYPYRRGRPTTYALGEEGSRYYRPPTDYYRRRPNPPGTVTTFALGEEGAGTYRQ